MARWTPRMLCLVVVAATGACRATLDDPTALKDGATCPGSSWYPDDDGDGFGDPSRGTDTCDAPGFTWTREGGDCDDASASVHPRAAEVADRQDNNCDGTVDEGTVFDDVDGDGACGDPVGPCADPAWVPGDCDDDDAARGPSVAERCDGVDNDCDGVVPVAEQDGDRDGFAACDDCDDGDPTRFPGAAESCDGIDHDCDGAVRDVDADGDGWGGCPTGGGLVDVVLLIDGRASAETARARFAAHAEAFVQTMRDGDRQGRVLVLAADSPMVLAEGTTADGDLGADVAQAVLAAQGSDTTLLTTLAAWRVGPDGPREGSSIAVFVVTSGDDATAGLLDDAWDLVASGRTRDHVKVSAISGGWSGCKVGAVRADPAPRLAALVERTDGLSYDLCDDADWFVRTPRRWLPKVARDCDDAEPAAHPGGVEVCDGIDNTCDGLTDGDADGDGVGVCAGDCDDARADVHAGAPEICDGLDNDCVGGVPADERDQDGDGWWVCDGDCDDARADVYPTAAEVCGDGLDANCDGADDSSGDRADLDGDGWSSCDGDCDDSDPWAFPYAPEHKFDGRDDDCDGRVDGEDPDVVIPWTTPDSLGVWTVGGPSGWFTFCGEPMRTISVASEGYLLPGGGVVMDSLPDSQKMRDYAPFVAAGWQNLNPLLWSGDSTLLPGYLARAPVYVVKRPDSVSVVYDDVPYSAGGGALTSVTTLGQDLLAIHVLDALHDPVTVLGWACEDRPPIGLPLEDGFACVPTSVSAAAGVVPESVPLVVTSDCAP